MNIVEDRGEGTAWTPGWSWREAHT